MTRSARTLVTGAAGFIGYHVARRLLENGREVLGLDNLNAYYDVALKEARLEQLRAFEGFSFERLNLADRAGVERLFRSEPLAGIVHLAAQAGVRYSLTNPHAYVESNLAAFLNILEGCRAVEVPHLVFASSSSVYGGNTAMPFSTRDNVDHPVSLYAATKKANELMAHSYAHLFGVPSTGLRFFTVYGPWGRPDMALFRFTRAILKGEPIEIYNYGQMKRDFTFIDDVAESVVRVLERPPAPARERPGTLDPSASWAPYRLYNLGNASPVDLMTFVATLEEVLGRAAEKRFLPLQAGDVPETYADVQDFERDFGFRPATPLKAGIEAFVHWYRFYYGA
ncbi:MAG: NAD-dependent epimerase [Thermoanaerobaculia bacterium]